MSVAGVEHGPDQTPPEPGSARRRADADAEQIGMLEARVPAFHQLAGAYPPPYRARAATQQSGHEKRRVVRQTEAIVAAGQHPHARTLVPCSVAEAAGRVDPLRLELEQVLDAGKVPEQPEIERIVTKGIGGNRAKLARLPRARAVNPLGQCNVSVAHSAPPLQTRTLAREPRAV